MLGRRYHRCAFTLIELLVVIAILTLLITMLMPSLSRARQVALRAVCQSNFKHIGRTIHEFASTHIGRGPGKCAGTAANGEERGRGWAGYLNVEVLGMTHYWQATGGFIQERGPTALKNWVYCPSGRFWGSLYPGLYMMNRYANGGVHWDPAPPWGLDGTNVVPPPCSPLPDDGVPKWDYYGLGPPLEKFPSGNYQFLVFESEHGDSEGCARWPNGPIALGGSPPWAGPDDAFAFRHLLPADPSLYQKQATGVFVYIDGHVNYMTPNDRINYDDRFLFKQN